tara:strand:- start:7221 stop:9041 length:1821 start_codon:yes stop_codon:yes gene_type:complete
MLLRLVCVFACISLNLVWAGSVVSDAELPWRHGLAKYGDLKYSADFQHFDYVNPEAPKGGQIKQAAVGTFDNLNGFILKGVAADELALMYDTLMAASLDEAFSQYGLLAEAVQVGEKSQWVRYRLRPEARFHDGKPVTAEDVKFTFETLMEDGHPGFKAYYNDVDSVVVESLRVVRFDFAVEGNAELPLIVGQLTVLPKHYWQDKTFNKTTLEAPLGSGPYKISAFEQGKWIAYERDKNYWGRDLPVNRGRYNFDQVRFDYYKDGRVALEALKAGQFDYRAENNSKQWATGYDFPAVEEGRFIKEMLPHSQPTGMQGFVFNTRRDKFSDPTVRWALAQVFDFEWTNKTLFYGQYSRTTSYFSNSELASSGLPSEGELALLEPYREQLPQELFTQPYHIPTSDGSGYMRESLRAAAKALKKAGWVVEQGKLIDGKTGKPFQFEVLLYSPAFERIVLPYLSNLKRLGIDAKVRTVDVAQYQQRFQSFDFDMIVWSWGQSLSPGNEQLNMWGSEFADQTGSRNFAGIKSPVVDDLIEKLIMAPTREELITATRALDRVLLWGNYVVPHWHIRSHRLGYWNKFGRPEIIPPYGLDLYAWWVKQQPSHSDK